MFAVGDLLRIRSPHREGDRLKHKQDAEGRACNRYDFGAIALGPMKGATMLATLERLGVMPSFSRPRVSDDNPFSEAIFRTLKYVPEYPRVFESIEHARQWVNAFVQWYNNGHLHSGIGYVTPSSRHDGEDIAILTKRRETYAAARRRRPDRWSRTTRVWSRPDEVFLNPESNKAMAKNAASR